MATAKATNYRFRNRLIRACVILLVLVGGVRWVQSVPKADLREACQVLTVVSSQEKSSLLAAAAKDYNATTPGATAGCFRVAVRQVASGTAEAALARGWDEQTDGPRPDVWSPAATTWVVLLRQHRGLADASTLLPDSSPSLLQSPLVIAMPRPMAAAMGWPDAPLGWGDILSLAHDPGGWGRYGHPEWGRFQLGKTSPDSSTSGIHALIAAYFAATGLSADLTEQDVADPKVREFVSGVESSVVHYGGTVSTFLTNLQAADRSGRGPSYVSAIAVEEQQVWTYNHSTPAPVTPLVAVYPREGTLVADHPYVVLKAPWVDEARRAAAEDFLRHLMSDGPRRQFKAAGFRDGTGQAPPFMTPTSGFLPAQPAVVIKPPAPPVLAAIQSAWPAVRKRARILVVIDVSGSMDGSKLDLVKAAATNALDLLGPEDEVGLWIFSSNLDGALPYRQIEPIARLAQSRDALKRSINLLRAGGGTGLYRTARASADFMRTGLDRSRINAVLLLTDGQDTDNCCDLNPTVSALMARNESGAVRIFTIGYGTDADMGVLRRISGATEAVAYQATDTSSIGKVLADVVSNF